MTAIKTVKRGLRLASLAGLIAIGTTLSGLTPAAADGYSLKDTAPVVDASWANHWLVRVRASYLLMRDDVDKARISNSTFNLAPVIANGVLVGTGADVTNQLIPELDISYFLTNNIAAEIICCATRHRVDATGALLNSINTAAGALGQLGTGTEIASTWAIPATVLLQYHFHMGNGLKPYVGAGPTYAIFVGEKVGSNLQGATSKVEVQNTWGFTVQAGTDIDMGGNWFLNLDAKYMYLQPDVTWTAKGALAGIATSLIADDLRLDPWILSVGLGYKF
jgi:outer membrane protein